MLDFFSIYLGGVIYHGDVMGYHGSTCWDEFVKNGEHPQIMATYKYLHRYHYEYQQTYMNLNLNGNIVIGYTWDV